MDGKTHPYLPKHSKMELPFLGEGKGGAFNEMFFLPPTADFLNGQGPLFLPLWLLASCRA